MLHTLTFDPTAEELASRRSGTTEVMLFWSRTTRQATVKVEDDATGESVELALLPTDDPLDVFNHPYAYAASRGLLAA